MLGRRLLQIAIVLFALQAYAQGPQRPAQKPVTRNPHGALNIPCENCHTTLYETVKHVRDYNDDPVSKIYEEFNSDLAHRTCSQCGHVAPATPAKPAAKVS